MKLIIDIIDRMVIRDILTHNLEATSETDKVIIKALYNGIPVTDDIISRSALLNQIDTTDWSDVRLLVEDAPTIGKENDNGSKTDM